MTMNHRTLAASILEATSDGTLPVHEREFETFTINDPDMREVKSIVVASGIPASKVTGIRRVGNLLEADVRASGTILMAMDLATLGREKVNLVVKDRGIITLQFNKGIALPF